MKLAVFAYTRAGCRTAGRVCRALPEAERCCYAPPRLEAPGFAALDAGVYGEAFANMDALIFVGACGVAVRSIAPFVRDKKTDPAVLCLDERASFVIPLLSGHIGGANALAARLAGALGAKAVITTATDVNGKFAVDAWAAQNGCAIEDFALAKRFAAEILEHDLPLCSEFPVCPPLPGGVVAAEEGPFGVYIGCRTESPFGVTLRLIPRKLRVGLGCRRGTEQAAIRLPSGRSSGRTGWRWPPSPASRRSISSRTSRGCSPPAAQTAGRPGFILRRSCAPYRAALRARASSPPSRAWITSVSARRSMAAGGCWCKNRRWAA